LNYGWRGQKIVKNEFNLCCKGGDHRIYENSIFPVYVPEKIKIITPRSFIEIFISFFTTNSGPVLALCKQILMLQYLTPGRKRLRCTYQRFNYFNACVIWRIKQTNVKESYLIVSTQVLFLRLSTIYRI